MSDRHRGKVALVTGGSGGIGQAIAVRLAQEGALVGIADAAETESLIEGMGGHCFASRCAAEHSAQRHSRGSGWCAFMTGQTLLVDGGQGHT